MSATRVEVPLRWVDLDAQGHVNNAVVADYLQEARVALLLGGDLGYLLGDGTIVVSHQVEFRRSIQFSTEPIVVEVEVGEVRGASFKLGYRVLNQGEVAAVAVTRLCVWEQTTEKPRRLTDSERDWLQRRSVGHLGLRALPRWRVGDRSHDETLAVRWSDLDPYRHVNNVRVFDYVAEARIRMNPADSHSTRMEEAAAAGLTWVVARQDVDYLSPIRHRLAPYLIRTAFGAIGRTSMTLAAQIEDAGDVHARTTTVLVCADTDGRPVPVPQAMRAGLVRWPAVAL